MSDDLPRLNELCVDGRMQWSMGQRCWSAEPAEVVDALRDDGFQEYKAAEARTGRDRAASGGVWQGLNARTGAVASAIWVRRPEESRPSVFIEIDGQAVQGDLDQP